MARAPSSRSAKPSRKNFRKPIKNTNVTVGISGTGGGFQKFCRGEIDIADASRPISATEVAACEKSGIQYIELPIAYDGIAIAANPKNTWADKITVAELKTLWGPDAQGKVTKWNQVRKDWPNREIHLFGAGVDSGTYDYFTEAINGKAKASRGDFTSSEDDNVLVQGISNDELALGFLPFAYFEENSAKLKLVPVDDGKADNGAGAILPSPDTIRTGTYQPLSRPVFIYVSMKAAERPEVQRFVEFYMKNADTLVREVNYVGLGGGRLHDGRRPLCQTHHRIGLLGREHGRRHHRPAARERSRKVSAACRPGRSSGSSSGCCFSAQRCRC